MGLKHIRGSNGNGEAVLATVTAARSAGSTIITVDSVTNWPQDFIATAGKKLADNTLDPTTVIVFTGHLSGLSIVIDSIAPGYSDTRGSAVADVVVLKPTTQWANNINDTLAVSINDNGTLNTTQVTNAVSDWKTITTVPTLNASNGQREYVLSFPGVDYTDRLSAGMKLKGSRTVAAQTQSTSLNGTNQYWSKTSPTGMTFTDDFVVGAWIKLTSYPAVAASVVSRYNGTSGWFLNISPDGTLLLRGMNGGSGNYRGIQSYQSIPLNKWVHIAVQEDMSSHSNTSSTCYIMIDGVDVPASVVQSGTNPTALIQAGNLEVGSTNGGINPLAGAIQDAFVTSAKLTQAQVRAFKDQKLTTALATTYTMAAAIPFDGNGNDVSTNANNLTGSGGATATDTGTAFDTNLWGIITKTPTYSGGNTSVTVFTPQGAGIPNETLGTFSYSTARSPYGFPSARQKWQIYQPFLATGAGGSYPTWGNLANQQFVIPAGEFILKPFYSVQAYWAGASASVGVSTALGESPTVPIPETQRSAMITGNYNDSTFVCEYGVANTSQKTYYLVAQHAGSVTSVFLNADNGRSQFIAECAYL